MPVNKVFIVCLYSYDGKLSIDAKFEFEGYDNYVELLVPKEIQDDITNYFRTEKAEFEMWRKPIWPYEQSTCSVWISEEKYAEFILTFL